VVTVHKELDKDVQKYFVSGGFAFVHPDSSADICAVEAVALGDLDADAVRAGLAEYTAKLAALQGKGDDYEVAAAQVGGLGWVGGWRCGRVVAWVCCVPV
jgi:F-type H+-transporting ATPase subunit delta